MNKTPIPRLVDHRPRFASFRRTATTHTLFAFALVAAPAPHLRADAPLDYNRDVRPILSSVCYQCHGPDAEHREADLRLDVRDNAFAPRDGKPAIVPGEPSQSELVRRITSTDPDERMPPADSGRELTPEQIDVLRRWIEQGAAWSEHWSFVPPQRPPLPAVQAAAWVCNPIDAFVLARLEREGLKPSSEADRVTLLRRLSLDLIGLPPDVADVDAFRANEHPGAYEAHVDRLLKSPHYGEKWARHWLDAARYADSDGFEKDKPRFVWFYRDWVIDAFNRDLPYDQFIIEQLAGDLLPDATQAQQVATGFLRNSMINEEGGVDPEQFRMEAMFDRMDAIGKAVLGLTIQCAQCHSHKYDPLTHEEYYGLFAFVNNCHEGQITVYTPDQQRQRQDVLSSIRAAEDQLQRERPDWSAQMAAWEDEPLSRPEPDWTVLELEFDDNTIGGQKFLPQPDGSYLAQGYAPTKFRPRMVAKAPLESITAVRLELLTDPNLPHGGPGRSIDGTCALTEFDVEAAPSGDPGKFAKIAVSEATADVNPAEAPLDAIYNDKSNKTRVTGPVAYAIDGKDETAWGIDVGPGRRNQPRKAVFRLAEPIAHAGGAVLAVHLKQNHGGWNSDDNQTHNLGRFRLAVTGDAQAAADPLPCAVRAVLQVPRDQRTPEQVRTVFSHWRTTVPECQAANQQIEDLWKEHPAGASQLALLERTARRETHLLERGDFLKPAQAVPPGVPAFLHPLTTFAPPAPASASADASATAPQPDRLAFARWLVDRRSPTTARSIVNRLWQSCFGTGLVATSEDFGTQGEAPSHPELLDWLAVELMANGWSLKHIQRLIVTSATYRQSSVVTPDLHARDPQNRLLARGPRVRVAAESVRDIALAASGLLNPKVGGRSVYPTAPEFLFTPPASYGPKTWSFDTGPEKYRRALYTFRFRSVPYPMLQAFDAPNGDFACTRRVRSNTPLQALTTLNEPMFVECAQALALKTVRESGASDGERLDFAFRRCLSRAPRADEAAVLLELLERQVARFQAEGAQPWEFAAADPAAPPELPEGTTPADLAAWTAVARVVLNLDETITRE